MSIRRHSTLLPLTFVLMVVLGMAATAYAECGANEPLESCVNQWRRWEKTITSDLDYIGDGTLNPSRDLILTVKFTQTGGSTSYTGRAFWYGLDANGQLKPNGQPYGNSFRIRGAFPPGTSWHWVLTCATRGDARPNTPSCRDDLSLNNVNGDFRVESASGGVLYTNGLLHVEKVNPDPPALVFENKERFFWLGDTVWNANIGMDNPADPSQTPDWNELLNGRNGFTILQLGFAPLAALDNKSPAQKPFVNVGGAGCPPLPSTPASADQLVDKCHRFNPVWWRLFDDKVEKANQENIVVVLAGFIDPITDKAKQVPTNKTEATYFAEAVTARMLGNFVIYSPGFDHRLACLKDNLRTVGKDLAAVDLWKQGKKQRSIHPITNHTAGNTRKEDYKDTDRTRDGFPHADAWLNFELFQSGTPDKTPPVPTVASPCPDPPGNADPLQTMTDRAVTVADFVSKLTPVKPAFNGESVYPGTSPLDIHTPYRARQTAYYSMLSGAQGYTMGVCSVVNWGLTNFGCPGEWDPAHLGRQNPGVLRTIESTRVMRSIFQSLPVSWLQLKPQSGRIQNQPGPADKQMVLAFAGKTALLAYLPSDVAEIKINFNILGGITGLKNAIQWPTTWVANWLDPKTGECQIDPDTDQCRSVKPPNASSSMKGIFTFTKPDGIIDPLQCEQYTATNTPDCNDWVLRITKGPVTLAGTSGAQIQIVKSAGITAQTTDSLGKVLSQVLDDGSTGNPIGPQIATEAGGNSMVVWQTGMGPNAKILGQILNDHGNPVGGQLLIDSGQTASPGHPSVAALANGDFIVAWAGADPNHYGPWIRTRRYSQSTHQFAAAEFPVACSFVAGDYPQIASAGSSGGYIIAWEITEDSGIYVLKVDGSGNKSDARLAEVAGSTAVIENLDVTGSAIIVSYGLYAEDGTLIGADSPAVTLQPRSSCGPPPLAANDAFSTDANQALTITLPEFLANDAPGVTFHHADSKCVMNANGRACTYTPPFGFTGNDTFSYTVVDGAGRLGSAIVTIAVNPPLMANPDSFSMEGDSSLQISSTQLLSNDSPDAKFAGVQNPVNGIVSCVGSEPATCTFTPTVGFRGTASFEYLISRDGNPPFTIGTVTITVTAPSTMQITSRCTDGVCVFTAIAPNPNAVSLYIWRFGNEPTSVAAYKVNHRFMASGQYTVSVTVTYHFGLPQQQGSTTVDIHYAPAADWDTRVSGLGFQLDDFKLLMFPFGSTPAINWSPNAEDCYNPADGCGSVFVGSDTSCDFQNCRLVGLYSHNGVFDGTLRIMNAGQILKEYPVAFEAVNQQPSPSFTVTRPDPNVRNYAFTNADGGDDGPFPLTYEWDFGDGSHGTGAEDRTHFYAALGTYNATLTATDGDGLIGSFTKTIVVANVPPVPRATVNCSGLICELGGESSTDDGSNITSWNWNFGDGTTGSGSRVVHQYTAGCYNVTLTVVDGDGGSASTTLKVVAGPPLVSINTQVVVDAHVQSYSVLENGAPHWSTTNGNLNGILEPGETVVVEPTWPIAPSTQQLPVSAFGPSPWGNQYGFRDTAPWYDISAGISDCWSLGHCYAVFVLPQFAQSRPVHADIQFNETNLSTGQPTPGSPVKIHVGKSFTDVATTDWSYAGIESVLHFGVDTGCGGTQFCPGAVVTRGEVARWLMKAEHGASYQPPACAAAPFTDVPCSHPFAAWIAQLKAEGLTSGVGGGTYAPDQALTRAEAAVFLIRTKMGAAYVPPACSPDFGDVACSTGTPHWAAAWISDVKARGISKGCDLTEFCPNDAVDRAQAAALFAKTFGLRIDTLQCPIVTNNGFDFVRTHVDLDPIVDITFSPNPAVVGGPSTATMTIGDPPPVATDVTLSIDSPAASVPPTVTVPALGTSTTFAVTPSNITVRTTTHITAKYLGFTKTVALDICTQPPSITAHPTSRIIDNGQSTTLSVTATGGGGPLSYQWYEGITGNITRPVPGGTNSTLTITPLITTSYWVRVTATCGIKDSNTAVVTVCDPPLIPGPPLDDVVVLGNTATLTVAATGGDPLSYQWYEGTSGTTTMPINGATGTTYTTPAINVAHSYWVRVTSTCNGTKTKDSPTATVTPVTQITRRQVAANTVNSLTSITTNWTRPTQPGSLLVAVMSSSHVAAVGAFGVPSGWQQATNYEWNHLKTTIYYYPNNPGGRTAETITTASFRESVLQLIEYVGATASPLDVTAFDGDNTPRSGIVSTGTPAWPTSQAKAVIISALSTNALAHFTAATNGFTKLDEHSVYTFLTAAVHERIVTATGAYGHNANADSTSEWLGMVAAFKSIDGCTAVPAITAQPASSTVNAGSPATLSVTATGDSLQYQWYQGTAPSTTTPVPGGNGATLTVTPASTTSYWVRVFNACGAANSNTATVNVCVPPGVTTHPLSQSVTSGFSATLSVTASGSGPFSYQWYEGTSGTTTTPVGTNSATFTTPALTANKSYWVRVTSTCNGSSSVNSNTAVLTVSVANQIARRQLAASTANSQTSITTNWTQPTQAGNLLVAVLSAQNGAAVGNFTPPAGWQLATSNEMANVKSAIYYYPNHPGGRTSETFSVAGFRELVLQLIEYTGATASPLDKVALNGDMIVNGGVVSTGTTTATSQAKEAVVTALTIMAPATFTSPTNGFAKLDEHSVLTMITSAVHERIVSTAGAYGHDANVNANTQWVGLVATFKSLDLCSTAPSITTQPASSNVSSGGTATLAVTATTSGGTLSYQWYEGASGITTTPVGTNSPTFTTPALSATKSYWVRLSNACGSVNSNTATVTVCNPTGITTHPASQTINSGGTATLSVVAGGSGPFTYQWYEGASGTTTTPVGTNNASFTTPVLTTTKSYWVRVTGACGTASSNTATITVNVPAPARRQFAASTANSQQIITTNWTQPTQAGTLLVAIVSAQRSFYPIANWQPPAGWQLAVSYEMTNIKTSIYYYPNNPGGRTAETFANGGYFDDMIVQLAEYTGIVTASPLDKTAFNGDQSNTGTIDTGYTTQTSQAKELVITALTSGSTTDFSGPSAGFTEVDDRNQGFGTLTTAVHEKIVTTVGVQGHYAQVGNPAQWVGVVATFKGQ